MLAGVSTSFMSGLTTIPQCGGPESSDLIISHRVFIVFSLFAPWYDIYDIHGDMALFTWEFTSNWGDTMRYQWPTICRPVAIQTAWWLRYTYPSEKYEDSSIGMIIPLPIINEKIQVMFQSTNQFFSKSFFLFCFLSRDTIAKFPCFVSWENARGNEATSLHRGSHGHKTFGHENDQWLHMGFSQWECAITS